MYICFVFLYIYIYIYIYIYNNGLPMVPHFWTLLETAHTLPLYGKGCKFWRHKAADGQDTRGQYLVASATSPELRAGAALEST